MNDNPFRILETVCASTPNRQHYIILHAQNSLTGEKVWAIGDDQVCAVTREDFIRNRNVQYNDVLIQEFPYRENTPESVGNWRPLIQELVINSLQKNIQHDGLVHVYPQWLPEEVVPWMGPELFKKIVSENCDHLILYENNMMDFVPPEPESPSLCQ